MGEISMREAHGRHQNKTVNFPNQGNRSRKIVIVYIHGSDEILLQIVRSEAIYSTSKSPHIEFAASYSRTVPNFEGYLYLLKKPETFL